MIGAIADRTGHKKIGAKRESQAHDRRTTIVVVVTWIVVGALVLAVLVLVAALMALMGRARPLGRALRRLRLREEQARRLQGKLETLQERATGMQQQLAALAARDERT